MKLLATLLLAVTSTGIYAQQYDFTRKDNHIVEATTDNANASGIEWFNIRAQATYVYQYKPAFKGVLDSAYQLSHNEEDQNTLSATLYAGLRLWKGAEVYANPELTSGMGLSNGLGMATPGNGETFHISRPQLTVFLARAYFRQTFALRNKRARKNGYVNSTQLSSLPNQLAGYEPKDYLRIYAGKLSLTDLFDRNDFANSPRKQFMNYAFMNNSAWDIAADTRGYTYNFTTELQLGKMNYKIGVAALPTTANGNELDAGFSESLSAVAEVSRRISIKKRPGIIKLLGYYNTATMSTYEDAANLVYPSTSIALTPYAAKYGFGLNMQQELSNTFAAFIRIGWNDGKTQTWSFTEVDQAASLGLSANGTKWKRPHDNLGIAIAVNALSANHKDYITKGGYGLNIGGSKQSYTPEMIGELYYSLRPLKSALWFSGSYQLCMNPGYNSDRGPAHIFSLRVHATL